MKGYYIRTPGTDPGENLAIEEYLIGYSADMCVAILYLWQNHDTVVIGRNQCAYSECDLEYATSNGIRVVRRMTGGGAVYHDDGNINFSIILPLDLYDIERSTMVITDALGSLGINAVKTGRNDICLDGYKISGNAYYTNEYTGLHHGTILYRVDRERLGRVLNVSPKKLKSKGIKSVKSRVGDIVTLYPDVSPGDIEEAIRTSFMRIYSIDRLNELMVDNVCIARLAEKYRSDEWNIEKVGRDELGSDEL